MTEQGGARSRTLVELLIDAARRSPDACFLRTVGGDTSFSQFREYVERLAGFLSSLGVVEGDRVAVFMSNSEACVQSWFAANWLGAVWVPVNTEWRGKTLESALALADARVMVVDEDLVEHLPQPYSQWSTARKIVARNDAAGTPSLGRCLVHEFGAVDVAPSRPGSTSAMLYTSGSTGRSKACELSHRYFTTQASVAIRDFGLTETDVLYCPFPLFHADATALTVVPALILRTTAALGRRFSASGFWAEVRAFKATVFDFMGATLTILHKATSKADDHDNDVRLAWGVPLPGWAPEFEARFGLKLLELYGSVEASLPITQHWSAPRVLGSCGRQNADFEVRVVDENDDEVPHGQSGELVIRSRDSYAIFSGYYKNPDATLAATKNLWFHSGDVMRRDEAGNYFFVGRKKDVIRRRGENISAFEVEEAAQYFDGVLECAAIGVPSELTEEEVALFVVARDGYALTEEQLWNFCAANMSRFQVPRYIKILLELPKTPTGKIDKPSLRTDHRTLGDFWDAEQHDSVLVEQRNGTEG